MIYYFYLAILLICGAVCTYLGAHDKGMRYLKWSIAVSILAESFIFYRVEVLEVSPLPVYHIFLPTNYVLMAYFFRHYMTLKFMKHLMLISIGLVVGGCVMLSGLFYKSWFVFPFIQNLGLSVFYCFLASNLLLHLEPLYGISILKHPHAWICIGVVIFNMGSFFLTGVYSSLGELANQNQLGLYFLVNILLNCVLYLCFMLAMYFSHKLRRIVKSSQV